MNLSLLKEAQVGSISTSKQTEARKMITERWEGLNFLNGTYGYLKENLATLFENEANMMLNESTDAQNSGSFETVVFPLVRRVFSRLLANDIVSVQAMNMPIGKLFFILPVTSERDWTETFVEGATGTHAGLMGYERKNRNSGTSGVTEYEKVFYLPDDVVTEGQNAKVTEYYKKSLYDMFYNDGLFDQSKGKIHIKVGEMKPVKGFDYKGQTITGSTKLAFDQTVRNIMMTVEGFSSVNAGKLIGPDGNEMDTEAFLASLKVITTKAITPATISGLTTAAYEEMEPVHFRCVSQRYGKGLVEDGKIMLELDLAKPTVQQGKTIDGFVGVDPSQISFDNLAATFKCAWCQYDSLELETEMGEVSFKLSDVTVSVEERKLRATWSPELAQDVAAFHNIDAEAELTAILSEQIAAEIDREILRDLRKASPWQLKWDYNGWRRMSGFSTNYTQKDWNQTLMTKINQLSAQIHKATLRGGANFIVVSTEISAVLNDLEYFHVTDANAEAIQYSMGIEKVGSINGRFDVFVDPYSPAQSAILGHKGDSLLDTGYIYAPYVPMQLTPTIYNPFNFAPVKGIITRYAKKLVNNRYYGSLVAVGLQTWNIEELR